jgi:hypothetical protein
MILCGLGLCYLKTYILSILPTHPSYNKPMNFQYIIHFYFQYGLLYNE